MFRPERLAAFCDGVIAIAITLLVLGLEVPSIHEVPDRELSEYLSDCLHPLLGYISSFVLVGTYWLQHYVIFHYVTRVDRVFIALNGLFLLSISFVPFPTGLEATYRGDELAMVLYTGTQAVCGFALMAIWTYATTNHRLISANTTSEVIRSMKWRISLTPAISLAAMLMSFVSIDLSRAMFLAIPAVYLVHQVVDDGWISSDKEREPSTTT